MHSGSLSMQCRGIISDMRTILRASLLVCGVLLGVVGLPRVAHAQTLTGVVISADGGTPITAAVLVVLDAQQKERARVALSSTGRFVLSVPSGVYRLRVLRVGYAPFDGGEVRVDGTTPPTTVQWRGTPVALPQVLVRERQQCDLTKAQGATLAVVWEQISAALGVTDASTDAPTATTRQFDRYGFVRRLDAEGRLVRGITQQRTRGVSLTSYRAWDPDSLAMQGYLREDATGSTFYGPTASTLVSPAFLRTHCFELIDRPDGNRERLIVRFEPATPRERVVDIAGSFWVDRRTARLDSVQFRYTGLPAFVTPEQARGSVQFAQLPDGSWFVSQWTLRMPRIGDRARRSSDNLRRTTFALEERAVTEMQEEGGVVLAVEAGQVQHYRAALPTLRVQFERPAPWMAAASVRVRGTDIAAPIDSLGRVMFSVPQGRYDLTLHWPFAAAGDTAAWNLASGIATRHDTMADSVRTPTGDALLRHLCGAEPQRMRQAAIWGTVTDSLGKPLVGATVKAKWVDAVRLPSTASGDRLSASAHELQSITTTGGHFLVCGVPRTQFVVEASAGDPGAPLMGHTSAYLTDASRFELVNTLVAKPVAPGK